MKVWQIAAGEKGRNYSDYFLQNDIMFIGPSHLGPGEGDVYRGKANSSNQQVNNFCNEPIEGDVFLLRLGLEVIAIGKLGGFGHYSYSQYFSCVLGWDLCHTRRISWNSDLVSSDLRKVFSSVKQKPSFSRVHEKRIISILSKLRLDELPSQSFVPLNLSCEDIDNETLGVELFKAGLSNKNIEDILAAMQQGERLCSWYREQSTSGRWPTEFEVVSHIIVPLLLGLGWSHQQIAVEWDKVDVALFETLPTSKGSCKIIIEAKGLGKPLGLVNQQPLDYIKKKNLSNVSKYVITDGENFFIFGKMNNDWVDEPIGYFNLSHRKRDYVIPKNSGFASSLIMLKA